MRPVTIRFHDALDRAKTFLLHEQPHLGDRRLLVRDLHGRLRVFIADKPNWRKGLTAAGEALRAQHAPLLHTDLTPWSADPTTLLQDARVLADFDALWSDPDAIELDPHTRLLERGVVGADWLRDPLPNQPPTPPRATLFGLKGGVGRSTALAVWARHLSEVERKRVLVVDLDLDAPGVGSMLLPQETLPDFGVVDWFVEQAVGQGASLLDEIDATSPLVHGTSGEIRVVPAAGKKTGAYLPKLARVYQGGHHNGADIGFGDLLARFLDDLEARLTPDVVLLDSRSGLHDIAAVTLTRLGALALLFAVDTPQTWVGYRHLVTPWQDALLNQRHRMDPVRRRLQVIAGQVPERDRVAYLDRLRVHAYEVFSALYDADPPPGTPTPPHLFAFDPSDETAPHHAIPLYWSPVLADWDPVGRPEAVTPEQLTAAFGPFVERATELLGL